MQVFCLFVFGHGDPLYFLEILELTCKVPISVGPLFLFDDAVCPCLLYDAMIIETLLLEKCSSFCD